MTTDAASSTPTRSRRSDPALQALYAQHFATVQKALNFLGVPRSEQADVATEVWIVAFCRWGDEPIRDPGAWLFAIAQRCAFTHRRVWARLARALDITEEQNMPGVDTFTEAQKGAQAEARAQLLDQALDSLTPEERDVFVAHALRGMSLSAYARSKGITRKVINKRYATAKRRVFAIVVGLEQRAPQKAGACLPFAALAWLHTDDTEAMRAEIWARAWDALESYRPIAKPTSDGPKPPTRTPPRPRALPLKLPLGLPLGLPLVVPVLKFLGGGVSCVVVAMALWQACAPVPARDVAPSSPTMAMVAEGTPLVTSSATPETAMPSAPSVTPTVALPPVESAASPPSNTAPPIAPRPNSPASSAPSRLVVNELTLIRGASAAIQEGRYDDAERNLAQHAQEYPKGAMAGDREMLRESLREARQSSQAGVNIGPP